MRKKLPDFQHGKWISAAKYDGTIQRFEIRFQIDAETDLPQGIQLYICGLGYFDASVNGHLLDDSFFKPLMTDYSERENKYDGLHSNFIKPNAGHRVCCYTYQIDEFLHTGDNLLEVRVAPGYYCNTDRLQEEPDYNYGEPILFYEIHKADGTVLGYSGDGSCKVRGSAVQSSIYNGDYIDFGQEEKEWESVVTVQGPCGEFTLPMMADDKIIERLRPIVCKRRRSDSLDRVFLDFGKNHTGGLSFWAKGRAGDKITIRYAEMADDEGRLEFDSSTFSSEQGDVHIQENIYILSGGEDEIYPQFSWRCYRYAEILLPKPTELGEIESLFISSDIEQDGDFHCSEEVLNRLHEAARLTYRCNLHSGMLSDCPHREKRPYTGDGRLVMKSMLYMMDSESFYRKWLIDLFDAQQEDGLIPNSAPFLGGGGGYAWANALCTVPELLYRFSGDLGVVEEAYPRLLRLLDYYEAHHDGDYIIRRNGHEWMLGDWLAPEPIRSDVHYISTVCYLEAAETTLTFAERLCECDEYKEQEISHLKELVQNIREAVNDTFFHEDTLNYGNGVQGENVLALAFRLPQTEEVRERLREKVREHYTKETDYHLDTGIVLTPILIDYLTEYGMEDIAFRIMTNRTYPSYSSLLEGDTTLSEHWSKKWPTYVFKEGESNEVEGGGDTSHCHPMYGSTVSWLYERVAGLDLSHLYEKKMRIYPAFLAHMREAEAKKITDVGEAQVKWRTDEGALQLKICVPKGLQGECRFAFDAPSLTILETGTRIEPMNGRFEIDLSEGTWTILSGNKK